MSRSLRRIKDKTKEVFDKEAVIKKSSNKKNLGISNELVVTRDEVPDEKKKNYSENVHHDTTSSEEKSEESEEINNADKYYEFSTEEEDENKEEEKKIEDESVCKKCLQHLEDIKQLEKEIARLKKKSK